MALKSRFGTVGQIAVIALPTGSRDIYGVHEPVKDSHSCHGRGWVQTEMVRQFVQPSNLQMTLMHKGAARKIFSSAPLPYEQYFVGLVHLLARKRHTGLGQLPTRHVTAAHNGPCFSTPGSTAARQQQQQHSCDHFQVYTILATFAAGIGIRFCEKQRARQHSLVNSCPPPNGKFLELSPPKICF